MPFHSSVHTSHSSDWCLQESVQCLPLYHSPNFVHQRHPIREANMQYLILSEDTLTITFKANIALTYRCQNTTELICVLSFYNAHEIAICCNPPAHNFIRDRKKLVQSSTDKHLSVLCFYKITRISNFFFFFCGQNILTEGVFLT
jgi:hypothetical protein